MAQVTYEEVLADIKGQVYELMGVPVDEVTEDSLMVEDLGGTSITILQIYLNLQDKYDITLADDINFLAPISVREVAQRVVELCTEQQDEQPATQVAE